MMSPKELTCESNVSYVTASGVRPDMALDYRQQSTPQISPGE